MRPYSTSIGGQPNLVVNPSSPYLANFYDDVWCSTASGAQTVNLPATPQNGWFIGVVRQGTNLLTIGANGNTIAGVAADLVLNTDKVGVWLRWNATASTWQVEPRSIN